MTRSSIRVLVIVGIALIVVACGTAARPVFEEPEEEIVAEAVDDGETVVAVVPTSTPIPPTVTPEPPTATPTEEATATPTEEPTAAPSDPIVRLVSIRDAENGEVLFKEFYPDAGFACSTCHNVDNPDKLVGPSLLGIPERAGTRVEGQVAERYLYNSIVNPNEYLVEDYPADLMPTNWHDILSDTEIYDIIAYLMTLHES